MLRVEHNRTTRGIGERIAEISRGRKVNPCALVSLSTHGWCEEHRRSMLPLLRELAVATIIAEPRRFVVAFRNPSMKGIELRKHTPDRRPQVSSSLYKFTFIEIAHSDTLLIIAVKIGNDIET